MLKLCDRADESQLFRYTGSFQDANLTADIQVPNRPH